MRAAPEGANSVTVPQAWREAGATRGPVWYWREFTLPAKWKTMNVRLRVRAPGAARYWVNGKPLREPEVPSIPDTFDITRLVAPAGPNVLAVRSSGGAISARAEDRAPHLPSPEALLIASDEAHITGVTVSASSNGWVAVRVGLMNTTEKSGGAELRVEILEGAGRRPRLQAESTQNISVSPGLNRTEVLLRVKKPQFSTTDSPAPYRAVVSFRQTKDLLDNVDEPFVFTR